GSNYDSATGRAGADEPSAGTVLLLLGRVCRARVVLRHARHPAVVPDDRAALHGYQRGEHLLRLQDDVLLLAAPRRVPGRPLLRTLLDDRRLLGPLRLGALHSGN